MVAALILLGLYVGFPAYQIFQFLARSLSGTIMDQAQYAWSIALYFWMNGNLLLASRIPFIENHFPRDKRIRFHIFSGLAITTGFTIHVFAKLLGGYYIDFVSLSLLFGMVIFLSLSYFWVKTPVTKKLHNFAQSKFRKQKKLNYDALKIVHNYGFALLNILMYIHITQADLLYMTTIVGEYIYILSFFIPFSIWMWSIIRRFIRTQAEVIKITRLDSISVLTLKTNRPLKYKAGQFAYLSRNKTVWHNAESHPFSFLSSPKTSTPDIVQFGIGHKGDFSAEIISLKPGDTVLIDGSYGAFKPTKDKPGFLIGTGIGAVPVLSLIANPSTGEQKNRAIVRLKGADKKLVDICDPNGKLQHNGNLKILGENGEPLYFDSDYISRQQQAGVDWDYLICSSTPIREKLVEVLLTAGVAKKKILYEQFSF